MEKYRAALVSTGSTLFLSTLYMQLSVIEVLSHSKLLDVMSFLVRVTPQCHIS